MGRQADVITVAIPRDRLHADAPRGVVRVARAVAERLVGRPGLRLLAVSDPVYDNNDLLFEYEELGTWMATHPMQIPAPPAPPPPEPAPPPPPLTPLAKLKRKARTTLARVGLAGVGRFGYRAIRKLWRLSKRPLRGVFRMVGADDAARRVLWAIRGKPPLPPRPPAPPPVVEAPPLPPLLECISLRNLDVFVSFECYDSIWDWPTELFGCKLIGVFHDAIPLRINEGAHWNPGKCIRALGQMVLRAHSIGCVSRSAMEDLETFLPIARGKTWLGYNGVDADRFLPSAGVPAEPHPVARLPGRKIAMIGEVEPRKNQAGVFRACRHLADAAPGERITLVLIGKPVAHDPYRFLAAEAGRHVDVVHAGYVPDDQIGDLLRACDVFVYPSLWEGFGIPVLEAMFAGVPVVCADVSSLPEVGGDHVFYCDPYDPARIAGAVRKALELTPAERAAWVRAAREWAGRFSWDRSADDLAAAIERAAGPLAVAEPRQRAG